MQSPWFICGPKIYKYAGWTFEVHSYCGPAPLTKHGDPWRRIPARFWAMWKTFSSLTKDEQEKHRAALDAAGGQE